jgi:hypothetical protein
VSVRKHIPVLLLLLTLAASSAMAQARWGNWQDKQDNSHRQGQGQGQKRPHAGDWLRDHKNQPLAEQQKALESDPISATTA